MEKDQHKFKPGITIPRFPRKLPGTIWGMTTFFNPVKYKNKLENYRKFRESSRKQGLKLLAVELAFFDEPFELDKNDAEILIRVRSKSPMWQKERLLNIGLRHLPKDCDKVVWLDCDLVFKNDNWLKETSDLLGNYVALQLFSYIVYMPENAVPENFDAARINYGIFESEFSHSFASAAAFLPDVHSLKDDEVRGRPAGALAMRRKNLEETGFYDKMILGSNDVIFINSLYGKKYQPLIDEYPESLQRDLEKWVNKNFLSARGSVFYVNNIALHLWHGNIIDRFGGVNREALLKKYDFDYSRDLKLNDDGCFEWASDKKEFHRAVINYFLSRKEGEIKSSNI